MATKVKESVILEQHRNHAFCTKENADKMNAARLANKPDTIPELLAKPDEDEYLYKVASLKNRLTPAIGSCIRANEVERLIKEGVDVNIKPIS